MKKERYVPIRRTGVILLDAQTRIRMIRLMEKLERYPEYAEELGIEIKMKNLNEERRDSDR